MTSHTDLIYVYELTKNALDNIKDLERKMRKYDQKNKTRKRYGGKRRKKTRNQRGLKREKIFLVHPLNHRLM